MHTHSESSELSRRSPCAAEKTIFGTSAGKKAKRREGIIAFGLCIYIYIYIYTSLSQYLSLSISLSLSIYIYIYTYIYNTKQRDTLTTLASPQLTAVFRAGILPAYGFDSVVISP